MLYTPGMTKHHPNRIYEIRTAKGLTQQQLADMIGTTNQQVGYLENGRRRLSTPWIDKLCDALSVSAGELFEASELDVPHVSWVEAGRFAETTDPYVPQGTPRIAVSGLGPGVHIALTVDGDSMNRIAPEGSIIVVNLDDQELRPGKDYVFRMNDQATFKRWREEPQRLEPYSTNPEHETIFPDAAIEVVGRVVKVFMDL